MTGFKDGGRKRQSLEWQMDKSWSDAYLVTIKAICGVYFIGEATIEEDQRHNTDLYVLQIQGIRIAVRIRRYSYWMAQTPSQLFAYRGEFTIRNSRPFGTKTEFEKIKEEWGDVFCYAFAGEQPPLLAGIGLLNLARFRDYVKEYQTRFHRDPGLVKTNPDGTTFRVFRWGDMPDAAIYAAYPTAVANGRGRVPIEVRQAVHFAIDVSEGEREEAD